MQIERIDLADDDVLRACHAVHAAAAAADDPQGEPPGSPRTLKAWLTPGWSGEPSEAWYVPTDSAAGPAGECGPVAAWYRIQFPDLENRDRAFLSPVVHPGLRQRGLGTEMIMHARGRAAAQGRAFIDSQTIHGSAGEAFARHLGA